MRSPIRTARRVIRALAIGVVVMLASPTAAQDGIAAGGPGIELEVREREARAIDVGSLRTALAQDLGVEVRAVAGGPALAPRIRVRAIGRARAVLELVRTDGSRMRRSVELDPDPTERLETIVILAGNMVRDEASELLELLARRRRAAEEIAGAGREAVAETEAETETENETETETETVETRAEAVAAEAEAVETRAEAVETRAEAVATEAEAVEPRAEAVATEAEPSTEAEVGTSAETGTHDVSGDAARPIGSPRITEVRRPVARQRSIRLALGGLVGSVPRGAGYEVTAIAGLELAWNPERFVAIGARDLGGGVPTARGGWSAGGALFAELAWVLDPALDLHAQLGVDVRASGMSDQESVGVAPLLVIGARLVPIPELSIAVQTALHAVASDSWSTIPHALPQGAVLWTGGLSIATHL